MPTSGERLWVAVPLALFLALALGRVGVGQQYNTRKQHQQPAAQGRPGHSEEKIPNAA